MGTLLHLKNIYIKAFDDCKPEYIVIFLKIYSIFCAIMLFVALYAFLHRAITGFDFH